jgi:hypothetical protein
MFEMKCTFVPELHLVGLLHELAVVVVAEGAVLGVPERPDATLLVQQHGELGSAPNLIRGKSYGLFCVTGGKASSVRDPRYFGADPDPRMRIRTKIFSDL